MSLYHMNKKTRQDSANFFLFMWYSDIHSNSYAASRPELFFNFGNYWFLILLLSLGLPNLYLCVHLDFQGSMLRLGWWLFLSEFLEGLRLLNMAFSNAERPNNRHQSHLLQVMPFYCQCLPFDIPRYYLHPKPIIVLRMSQASTCGKEDVTKK
jgi:hypothetical protein